MSTVLRPEPSSGEYQLPIAGRWLIAVLAVIVEGFASLQLLSLRRSPFVTGPLR